MSEYVMKGVLFMDKKYISGGTMRTCPYSESVEIITFTDNGDSFDRSKCSYFSECTDENCPLCFHLKN